MEKKYVLDMTEGKEASLLLRFAMPMLIGNIFQQFYNMVDSIVVGKYVGSNALASVGVTGAINFLFFSICLGMASGVGVLISQFFGAKDYEYVKKSIYNTVYIILFSGLLMSIIGVFAARPILVLLNTPEAILADAVTYMQIVCGGTLAVGAYNAVSAILRALGDSKTPLFFLVIASLLNVVLDMVFVVGFGMGVSGAAWATIISQAFAAVLCLVHAVRKNSFFCIEKEYRTFEWGIISQSARIGLPMAAQSALIAMSCIILQSVVNRFGEVVVAAFTATNRVEQLVQQPFNSLGVAVSTFTGQNMGAGKLDRVKKAYHKSIIMVFLFSMFMFLMFAIGNTAIMKLFVNEPEVIDMGSKGLVLTSYMYFGLGMIYITRGLLNGAGDAVYSVINGLVEVIGRVGFSMLLVTIPVFGVWGVWYATGFTWLLAGLASILRYRQGKWKKITFSR